MSVLSKLDNSLPTRPSHFYSHPPSHPPSICSSLCLFIHGKHAPSDQYVPDIIWGPENMVLKTLRVFGEKQTHSKKVYRSVPGCVCASFQDYSEDRSKDSLKFLFASSFFPAESLWPLLMALIVYLYKQKNKLTDKHRTLKVVQTRQLPPSWGREESIGLSSGPADQVGDSRASDVLSLLKK